MSERDDGGPAFPLDAAEAVAVAVTNLPPGTNDVDYIAKLTRLRSGMSLRDYFAAKAMQALIIAKAPSIELNARGWPMFAEVDAYLIADAMLKARKL